MAENNSGGLRDLMLKKVMSGELFEAHAKTKVSQKRRNQLRALLNPEVKMAGAGDVAKEAAKLIRKMAKELPAAEASQKTQILGTEPTYRKALGILERELPGGRTLDYGSGLGHGAALMRADSFEPFPRQGVTPTFIKPGDIPSEGYDRLTNLNMLNVVPRDVRDASVENIGRVLRPGGVGIVTTRGRDVMNASGDLGPEPMSVITSIGTYQKGFTPQELREYLEHILGKGYDISRLNLGPAGALIRKKDKGMKRGGGAEAGTLAAMDTGKVEMRKAPGAKKAEKILSGAAEFIPFVGAGKAAAEGDYPSAALQGALDVAGGPLLKGAATLGGKAIPALAGIFIGPKSKLWNAEKARQFEDILNATGDLKVAYKRTGTFIGADGRLRQEISDEALRLRTPDELARMMDEKSREAADLRVKMGYKTGSRQRDLFPAELTKARAEAKPRLDELDKDLGAFEYDPTRHGLPARLAMEHPELFAAYPEMKDVMVRTGVKDLGKGVHAAIDLGGRNPTISLAHPSLVDKDFSTPEQSLAHEFQHLVQHSEGFEGGSSPRDALTMVVMSRARELEGQGMPYKDALSKASDEYRGRAGELYNRMAGEAESRATEARIDMPMQKRLENFPPEQQYRDTIPYEEQLLQRNYGGYLPYKAGGEVHAADGGSQGLSLLFPYQKPGFDDEAYKNYLLQKQFGKVDIPAPYNVKPEEITAARAMESAPREEESASRKALRALLKAGKEQGKKEIESLKEPGAIPDLINRGLIANNPISGAIDLANMALQPIGLGSDMPIGGSAHIQKLMKDYGITRQERPMLETGLSMAMPFAIPAAQKTGEVARKVAPAAREALHGALERGMESGAILDPRMQAIKPVGGQWLTGYGGKTAVVDFPYLRHVDPRELDTGQKLIESLTAERAATTDPAKIASLDERIQLIQSGLESLKKVGALAGWATKNVQNYARTQMGTPEDPILRLAEEWPAQKEQMLAERQKRLNELNAKKEGIKTMPVPADVRDPDAWRQARVRSVNEKIDQVKEDIERIEERNPIHMPVQRGTFKETAEARERAGFPREGLAKTEIGKGWEALTDSMIHSIEAGKLRDPYYMADLESRAYDNSRGIAGAPPVSLEDIYLDRRFGKYGKLHYHKEMMSQNPWLSKVDPSTLIYKTDLQFGGGMPLDRSLGFDHVMDVLRRDIEAGRIRPEQLSKMSMEQAVRRTADYDAEKAVQMKKATAEEAKNLTPHMDFDDGYRIVRLDKPGQFAKESQRMAHSVEGYEPPINHPDYVEASNNAGSQYYGHGGWEAIKSGKAQVFSLRDEKGMPHVTIELGPETWPKGGPVQAFDAIGKKYTEAMDEAMARIGITNGKFPEGTTEEQRNQIQKNFDNTLKDIFIESGGKMTNPITQIKGKRNETPDEEYMPYVQKFIREGNYDIAGDLQNSGLIDTLGRNRPAFLPPDAPRYVTKEELDRMTKTGKFEPDFNRGGEVHMAGAGDVAKALAKVAKTAKKAGALSAVEAAPQEGRLLDIMSARVAPATTPRGTGLPLLPRSQGMYTPDVPQVDLPRQKGRGGKYTERMQALLDSPTARKKVNELIEKGEQLGMREWYGTEPLRQAAMDAGLSPEKFNELMAQLASASQRNPVDKQNQMGSYLWHLSQTGQLPEDAFLLTSRIKKNPLLAPPGTPVEFPKGLGSLAQTAIFERGRDIAHGNIEDVLPPTAKLGTFYRNLLGNLQPVTVDVNAVRGPVIAVKDPRWLTSKLVEKDEEGNVINTYFPRKMVESGEMTAKQAAERPGFWEAAPEGSEYKGFEELWQRAAKRHDIAPAEAQALGWYGSGDITALKTKPELYIDNLERLIRRTADQTGKAPTEVLNDFLTGKGFLYKEGGFATTKVKKRSKNG